MVSIKSHTIKLTDSEIRICEWLAKNRYANNRQSSVTDRKIGPQSCDETDIEGICGEFAFCKSMGIYPDMSVSVRKNGHDFLHNGKRLDIKTTKYQNGKLLAVSSKTVSDVDSYVLVIGKRPSYLIAGWCKSEDLIREENLIDLGYGTTYCLPQNKLSKNLSEI